MSDLTNPSAILYGANNLTSGGGIASINDGTYNRLAVSTVPSAGMVPSQRPAGVGVAAKTVFSWLTTGGGSTGTVNMIVNGSTTAQVYYFSPKVATLFVYFIRIIMSASSFALSGASFGGAGTGGLFGTNNPAALGKGLVVSATSGGTTSTLTTLTINEDFFAVNGDGRCENAGTGMAMVCDVILNQSLILNSTDQVAVTVNDNMTGRNLMSLRACFGGVRP